MAASPIERQVKLRPQDEIRETMNLDSQDCECTHENGSVYSVFTKSQKATIVCLIAAAGFFSPFTAFIYFPALRTIALDLDVSLELMNLTIMAYLVVQAIAPAVLADFSENAGRRPVYLLIFTIYCSASVGLGLQRHYAALLVLRMVQSLGSSGAVTMAYGVIGDISAPHERGTYVGASHIGFNSAPAIGPLIGGLIADKASWPWIFGLLAALSGLLLVCLGLLLRETARRVVGNGSQAPQGINWAPIQFFDKQKPDFSGSRRKFRMPNIIPCLRLVFKRHTFPVLYSNAMFYMVYSCLQATLATLFETHYGLSPLKAGLCYLSFGISAGVASYAVGWVTDYDYRVAARNHNISIDSRRGDDMVHFPIEEARLRTVFLYIPICAFSTIAYGWALLKHAHLSIPLTLQFLIGLSVTGIFNVCSTLMLDVNPGCPSTASASVSITRCLFAAGGLATIDRLIDVVGTGWAFTILGLFCLTSLPALWFVKARGWNWRVTKADRASRLREATVS